ncbi:MAG: EAL domain-containing protein [Gammaproteobacteria bacterium]
MTSDSLVQLERVVEEHDELLTARYDRYQLFSVFQPIYSFAHKRMVGCEGLTRVLDDNGGQIHPGQLLGGRHSIEETIYLDRLMRTLHVGNFSIRKRENAWLFLNVSPVVVINGHQHGDFFADLLAKYDFPPQRVVIEILETAIADEYALEATVASYQELGCMVAIDDFGAGHSNFERIWRLRPDIVKLDRSMIQRATTDPTIGRSLGLIVSLLHEIGGLVLAEGIETEEQAMLAITADVDMMQGFLLSGAATLKEPIPDCQRLFERLHDSIMQTSIDEEFEFLRSFRSYYDAFSRAANMLSAGLNLYTATEEIISMGEVLRIYVLNEYGAQIGENLTSPEQAVKRDPRLYPLTEARGASWGHRPYFRRAISRPGEVQLTRPYLSLTDARMCLTLSRTIQLRNERAVLCCDLAWHSGHTNK